LLAGVICILFPDFIFGRLIIPIANNFSEIGYIRQEATIRYLYKEWTGLIMYLIPLFGVGLLSLSFIWGRLEREAAGEALGSEARLDRKEDKITRLYAVGLAFIIIIGAALRTVNLNQSLWSDEITTVRDYIGSFRFWRYTELGNHWLYTFLGLISVKLFGESEFVVRLPAFLMSITAIPVIFYFTRSFLSEKEALFTAGALCISAFHIQYASIARGYSALALFALLSSFFFLRIILNKHAEKSENLLFGVFTLLGFLSHFYYIWVLLAQFLTIIILFIFERLVRKKVIILRAAVGSNLLYSLVIGQLVALVIYGPNFIPAVILKYLSWKGTGQIISFGSVGRLLTGSQNGFLGLVFSILIILSLIDLWGTPTRVLSLYFILLVVFPFAIVKIFLKGAQINYFIYTLPFLIIYLIHGIMVIARKKSFIILLCFFLLFIVLQSPPLVSYFSNYKAGLQDCRSAGQMIDRLASREDSVYAIGLGAGTIQYYIKKHKLKYLDPEVFFKQVATGRGRVWLVVTFPEYLYRQPEILRVHEFAKKNLRLLGYFPAAETDILVYVNRNL